MGKTTNIGWCHHTYNLWEGCFKVSPGCKHCYAESMNAWLRRGENWGEHAPRRIFSRAHYDQPLAWNREAIRAGERRRVFCGSVMDILEIHPDDAINAQLDTLRAGLWETILSTPQLDWLLLTKRIENAAEILPWGRYGAFATPFRNVWLGVTCENEDYTDRVRMLQDTYAYVRFVSYEPALGPINWRPLLSTTPNIHWVIFGDESGRKRRPAELEWARQTRDACETYGVNFYFKQWCGQDAPGLTGERDKKHKIHLPVLDGHQHREFPNAT